jgi:hypothetical protein
MFCNHHSSVGSCQHDENKGLWVQMIISKLLRQIAVLADGRCIIDGGDRLLH